MFKSIKKYIDLWIIVLTLVIILFPVIWTFFLSIKPIWVAFLSPPRLFFTPTFHAYWSTFISGPYSMYLLNSLIIAGSTSVISLILGSLAAYGFVRFKFSGQRMLLFWILANRMIPPIVIALPMYIMMARIRILDTYLAVILGHLTYILPFSIWMMSGFLQGIPLEMEEAALIDGCSQFGALVRIIIPISRNSLFATGIFCFAFSWNEFLFALLFTLYKAKPIPVAVTEFWAEMTVGWTEIAAVCTIYIIPGVLIALFLRRQFIRAFSLEGMNK